MFYLYGRQILSSTKIGAEKSERRQECEIPFLEHKACNSQTTDNINKNIIGGEQEDTQMYNEFLIVCEDERENNTFRLVLTSTFFLLFGIYFC